MPKRCTRIFVGEKYRCFAVTARQVIVKKLLYQLFIDAFNINIAQGCPVSKVGQPSKVIIDRVLCIAAVKQMQHESINVGC